jgi:hypothetical protein
MHAAMLNQLYISIVHASNFFLFILRWDVANNTWALPEALRPLILNFHFQRSGKTVYVITGFTGFIGAITGMKPVSRMSSVYIRKRNPEYK